VSAKLLGTTLCGATPPEVLVGSKTWPVVRLGPLIPPVSSSEAERYGNPVLLYGKPIDEIIKIRSQLVRSVFALGVKQARKPNPLLELTRELAMSSCPVDTEARFKKAPKPRLKFDGILAPSGPSGRVVELKVVGNLSVPKRVDQLVADQDVKAAVAMQELYESGISVYHITRLLSLGMLGRTKDRLLVPSRWSITATDASTAEWLRRKILDFDELGEIQLFSKTYAGNTYEVLLLPHPLSFELVEIWLPGCLYGPNLPEAFVESDHETWKGRSSFSETGGGYYAMKLPAYEYLYRIRRQAFIFAIREVTPDYYAPLGSWKIREALRDAFRSEPRRFGTVEEALKFMASGVRTSVDKWMRKAKLLRSFLTQSKLKEFLKRLEN
jgi:hypothetical protein